MYKPCFARRGGSLTLTLVMFFVCAANAQLSSRVQGDRMADQATTDRLAALKTLHLLNYYPSANSWDKMWTNWDAKVIDRDFGRIASLHANGVRIILQVATFGWPSPSSTMLDRLRQTVTLAAQHGLQVQLTLFDWWSDYSDIGDSMTWAAAVVAPYKSDPRIAFVELQNEIIPQNTTAMAWAQAILPFLQATAGNVPVTVSVTGGNGFLVSDQLWQLKTALGTAQPDFYDIHFYGGPNEAFYQIGRAQRVAGSRLLFIGETGQSTSESLFASSGLAPGRASREAYQDYFFRAVGVATSTLGIPAAAPWILWDFVPGSVNWVPPGSFQYEFGLLRTDSTAKRAAGTVRGQFSGAEVSPAFNNGFENWVSTPAGNLPTLWQTYMPALGHFGVDTAVYRHGHASAKIWQTSSSAQGNPSFWIAPLAQILPGMSYSASVWARGQNATGTTQICLAWFAQDYSYLGNVCDGALAGSTPWQKISVTGVAPPKVAWTLLFLSSADNSGSVWFDDVTFH